MNINDICIENEFFNEVKFYVKLYNIIDKPLILAFNANVEIFEDLIKNKKFINKIFKDNIALYNTNYKLIVIIT